MKFFIALLVVSVVAAAPQGHGGHSHRAQGAPASAPAQQGRNFGGFNPFNPAFTGRRSGAGNPYGPLAYGDGLNNPLAFHNRFTAERAVAVAKQFNLLVRINADGEVELTDKFGREADNIRIGPFGQDIDVNDLV